MPDDTQAQTRRAPHKEQHDDKHVEQFDPLPNALSLGEIIWACQTAHVIVRAFFKTFSNANKAFRRRAFKSSTTSELTILWSKFETRSFEAFSNASLELLPLLKKFDLKSSQFAGRVSNFGKIIFFTKISLYFLKIVLPKSLLLVEQLDTPSLSTKSQLKCQIYKAQPVPCKWVDFEVALWTSWD